MNCRGQRRDCKQAVMANDVPTIGFVGPEERPIIDGRLPGSYVESCGQDTRLACMQQPVMVPAQESSDWHALRAASAPRRQQSHDENQ